MMKNPIYSFSIIVFLLGGFLVLSLFGFWGIGTLIWLWGIYLILILTSYILKKAKTKDRKSVEWILIGAYVLFHSLYYIHWDVGTKIYFPNQKQAFIGNKQNFAIIFNVQGKPELPNNFFTDNKIYIPENGIVLTSSKKEDYKQRYSFPIQGTMKRFATSNFETFNCYGKDNYKFEYIIGSVNEKGIIDFAYRDFIANNICNLLEGQNIQNNLIKGYENGKSYLEQTQVYINNQNLTELPKGLLVLKNLEYLNIHSNSFKRFPNEVFMFPKLKDLTIGFNEIDTISKKIKHIKTLETLAVNGNNLKDLPDELLQLPNLETIYMRENKFDSLKLKEIIKKYESKGIKIQYE